MHVVALYSIKGGVGKTAAAVNLSYLAAGDGARTLLWDLDPQGAASFYFRIPPRVKGGAGKLLRRRPNPGASVKATDYEGLDLLPADFSYRNLDLELNRHKHRKRHLRRILESFAGAYDYVFLDCAPSISLVSENIFRASDLILSPIVPTPLSLRTRDQLSQFVDCRKLRDLRLWHFFSMMDGRRKLHRQIMESLRGSGGETDILRSFIPYSSVVESMGTRRAPVVAFAGGSAAADAFRSLWHEVRGLNQGGGRPSPP